MCCTHFFYRFSVAIFYWPAECYARNMPRLKGVYANLEKQMENIVDFVSISEMEWKGLMEDEQKTFIIEKIKSKLYLNDNGW